MSHVLLSLIDILRLSNFNGDVPQDLIHVSAITGHETTVYGLYRLLEKKQGVRLDVYYQVGRSAKPVLLGDFQLSGLDTPHHLTVSESGKMAALGLPHAQGGSVYTFDFLEYTNRFQVNLESDVPHYGSHLYIDRHARTLIVGSKHVSVYEYEGRGEWTHVRDFLKSDGV